MTTVLIELQGLVSHLRHLLEKLKMSGWRFMRSAWQIFLLMSLLSSLALPQGSAYAAGELSVTPITWNVIGLDSNNVNVGPNTFPVGARVCNTTGGQLTGILMTFNWVTTDTYINLRSNTYGTPGNPYPAVTLNGGQCKDIFFEVVITRNSSAYNHTAQYNIKATYGGNDFSTPSNREIFVEHLVSQNRNTILDLKLDGISKGVGENLALAVGQTYNVTLVGKTSTGYNQLESYVNIPNTLFQVNNVHTTYTEVSLAPATSDLLYADSCGWDNDLTNLDTYRSCVVSDGKSGGTVTVDYNLTILSGVGTSQPLFSMFYDFSGSSYHYNSDYSTSARSVSVVSPIGITKSFTPASVVAGNSSVLKINFTNTGLTDVTGVTLTDPLPSSPAQLVVSNTPGVDTTDIDCISPSVTAGAGASSIIFSGGVKAASTCSIMVNVTAPASPTSGTYINTTNNVFVSGVDTGQKANAILEVAATTTPSGVCGTIAEWKFTSTVPAEITNTPAATTDITNPKSAAALIGAGLTGTSNVLGTNAWSGENFTNANTLATANNEFFEFAVNTTGYSSIGFKFDYAVALNAQANKVNGPKSIELFYSTDGTVGTAFGTVINPAITASFVPVNQVFSGTANASGKTYFRIYGYDPGSPGSVDNLYLDNVAITGCGPAGAPSLGKSFDPSIIKQGGTSTLTFTITNPNTASLHGVSFTDILPAGLQVAATPNIQVITSCGVTPTATNQTVGGNTVGEIKLTNGTVPSSGCSFSVDVTGSLAGTYLNTTGQITSTESGPNTTPATSTLYVVEPPVFSKKFAPNPVYANEKSTLTFSITNPNTITLTGINFTDNLYTNVTNGNLVVFSTPGVTTNSKCNTTSHPSFAVTANAGANTISLANGSVLAGDVCTISVDVTSSSTFDFPNTANLTISSVTGLGTISASDSLSVIAHYPSISVLKQVSSSASGPWGTTLYTAAGDPVYYRIKVENTGDVDLSNLIVADDKFSLATCKWPGTLPKASATQDPTATCVIGPFTAASSGSLTNTATASGTYLTDTKTDTSSATYIISLLLLTKTITELSYTTVGDVLHYTYVVKNNGTTPIPQANFVGVIDNRTTVSCPVFSTVGNTNTDLDQNEQISCTATYTVTAADVSAASVTNGAYAKTTAGKSNTDYVTIYSSKPDLVVSKTNAVGGFGLVNTDVFWTIKTDNLGPVDATFTGSQVIIRDPLPVTAGVTYTLVTPAPSSSTNITGAGSILCSIDGSSILTCIPSGGDVILGASTGSFTVSVKVRSTVTGNFSNTVTVDPDNVITTEGNESNNTSTDVLSMYAMPDLTVVKSNNITGVTYDGNAFTWTMTVTNANATATFTNGTVLLRDPLPAGATYATLTGPTPTVTNLTCAVDGSNVLTCTAGTGGVTLAAGGSFAVSSVATPTASGTLSNTATVDPGSALPEGDETNNTGSDSVSVLARPTITKAFGLTDMASGGHTSLTLTNGNTNASAITLSSILTDTLPTGMTVRTTGNTGTCSGVTATAGATSISMANSTSIAAGGCTIIVDVTSSTAGAAVNTIAAGNLQTSAGTNAIAATDTLNVYIAPTLTKAIAATSLATGGSTTLTLMLTNPAANPGALTTVSVVDTFPTGMTLANTTFSYTPAACGTVTKDGTVASASGDGVLHLAVASLAAGSSCAAQVNITATSATGATLTNTTDAPAATGPVALTGTAASDSLDVYLAPTLTKAIAATSLASGGSTTMTLTLTNPAGNPGAMTTVSVADPFPTGMTLANTTFSYTPAACGAVTKDGTAASTSGDVAVHFAVASLAAGSSCAAQVNITATSATGATLTNTTGAPAATGPVALTGTAASDTLDVYLAPTLTKAIAATSLASAGSTTLTLTLANPAGNPGALTTVSVADPFPTGMTLANTTFSYTPAACGSVTKDGTAASVSGDGSLHFAVASLAADSSCAVQVNITATSATGATLTNTTGAPAATGPIALTGTAASDTLDVYIPPTVTKAFGTTAITSGQSAMMTLTLTNPAGNPGALTSVSVADTFPTGMTLANTSFTYTPSACGSVSKDGTIASTTGDGSVYLSVASLAVAGSCAVQVNVVGASGTDATLTNTTDAPAATGPVVLTGSTTSADLGITAQVAPTITKAFGLTDMVSGGNTSLTLTIGNTNAIAITLSSSLTDSLPTGMTVKTTGSTGTCSGVTATAGATSISMANGTSIASGGCTIIVDVTSSTAGAAVNTIAAGNLQTSAGSSASAATDTLNVYVAPTLTKAIAATSLASGGTTTLTLTLTNPAGNPGALTTVSVTDSFPTGMTLANTTFSYTPAACGTVTKDGTAASTSGDGLLHFAVASLAAGSSCAAQVNITATSATGATLTNTTGAPAATGPVALTGTAATDTLDVYAPPTVTKVFGASGISVGGSTTLTLTLVNPAGNPGGLSNVTVLDTFPPGMTLKDTTFTFSPNTPSNCGVLTKNGVTSSAAGDGSVHLAVSSLAAGSSCAVQVNIKVSSGSGTITNTTAAPAASGPVALTGTTASDSLLLDPKADLMIQKDDGTGTVIAGRSTTYTITVTNNGPSSVMNATLQDPFVTGLTKTSVSCTSLSGNVCVSGTTITTTDLEAGYSLPEMLSGDVYQIAVIVGVDVTSTAGAVDNIATISAPVGTTDPDSTNDSYTDTDTIDPAPDLTVALSNNAANPTIATVTFQWTALATNSTSESSFSTGDTILTEQMPTGANYTNLVKTNGATAPTGIIDCTYTNATRKITCVAGTGGVKLAAGATFKVEMDVTPTAAGSLVVDADVDTDLKVNETDETNNTDTQTLTIIASEPGLTLEKTASETSYSSVGDVINYSYKITNTGNVSISGPFSVNDDKTTVTCPSTPASLAPTEFLVCTAVYHVVQADLDAGSLTNIATASGDVTTSNEDSVTIDGQQARIGIAKYLVSAPTKVKAGVFEVKLDFRVRNYSNVIISSVQVLDDLKTTFAGKATYQVDSLTSTDFVVNPSFDGSLDKRLLNPTASKNTLAAGSSIKTIHLVLHVTPTATGPFDNTAVVSGKDPNNNPVSDDSQNGLDPDPDEDGNPGNNSVETPIQFSASLFDPPFGIKTVDSSGLPTLRWTMVWINETNIPALSARVSDPLSEGTKYAGDLVCTPASILTTVQKCLFEAPSTKYPRGRVIWEGKMGPDLGAMDAQSAKNEISISFNVTVNEGYTEVQNRALIDADINNDGIFDPVTENNIADSRSGWSKEKPGKLPNTGFVPGILSSLPVLPSSGFYQDYSTLKLEIPALKITADIVGVPFSDGVWDTTWLGNNAGYLSGTAFPAWDGNSVLTGHVTSFNGLPDLFANLYKLKWGDQVVVHAIGKRYVYEVQSVRTVMPTDTSVMQHKDKAWLTILTCKEYDAMTGVYKMRTAVQAILVNVTEE